VTSSNSLAIELADALHGQAVQAGTQAPGVRGSNWRIGIVATVGTDGTVTTSDGIIARRHDMYVSPAVNDRIRLTVSGSGEWMAVGRTAPASTAGTWVALSFAGSWSAWGSPYYTPAYRLNGDGTASLCGLARAPASTTTASTIATLPVEARPVSKCRFATHVNNGLLGGLDINTTGAVVVTDFSGTAVWTALDVAHYRLY
jgi:hypothetical protein